MRVHVDAHEGIVWRASVDPTEGRRGESERREGMAGRGSVADATTRATGRSRNGEKMELDGMFCKDAAKHFGWAREGEYVGSLSGDVRL